MRGIFRNKRIPPSVDLGLKPKKEKVMTKFGLIGATALSLTFALAAPALARDHHRVKGPVRALAAYPHVYAYGENLPVENALRWGYSQGTSYYPSGFGGLYGDGRYPGNVISNPNHPNR
jgi:hypothetical protein